MSPKSQLYDLLAVAAYRFDARIAADLIEEEGLYEAFHDDVVEAQGLSFNSITNADATAALIAQRRGLGHLSPYYSDLWPELRRAGLLPERVA